MSNTEARRLRQASTPLETLLWEHLRDGRLAGAKFRRQHPLGPYVLDFYCARARLVIEVDGSQHLDFAADRRRDAYLSERGLRVLRFWNNEVGGNLHAVLEEILAAVNARGSS